MLWPSSKTRGLFYLIKYADRALVLWLREETRNQKVVSSNPGVTFFTFICCKNCNVCLKRQK